MNQNKPQYLYPKYQELWIKNKKNHQFNGTVYVTYKTQEENNNAMTNIKRKPLNYMIPTVEEAKKREY